MKEQLKEKKTENQVAFIPNSMLIYTVAAGIGLFLVLAFLRILYGSACPQMLTANFLYSLLYLSLPQMSSDKLIEQEKISYLLTARC